MLLFVACLILATVFMELAIECDSDLSLGLSVILHLTAVTMLIAAFFSNIPFVNSNVAENQQLYDSLTYQLENDIYEGDLYGKSKLYEQITEWNTDLAKNKALQHDIWVGMFYPDIYDQFEFIKLP